MIPAILILVVLVTGIVALTLNARRQYQLHHQLEKHEVVQGSPQPSIQSPTIISISGWWFIAWWWIPLLMRVLAIGPRTAWLEGRKMIRVMYEHRNTPAPSVEVEEIREEETESEEKVVPHTPIAANSVIYAEEKEEPEEEEHTSENENQNHSHSSSTYVDALKPGTGAFDFVGLLKQDPGAFLVVMRGIVFTIDLLYRAEVKGCISRDMLTRNQNRDSETEFLRKLAATNYNYLIGGETSEGLLRETGIIVIERRNDGEPTGRSLWPYETVEEAWAKLEPQLLAYIEKNKDQLTARSA